MAAFRKLVLGMAAATVFAAVASAQTAQPALQCVANAGVPPTVRAEGLTELVGDVTLNCTGGVPTQFNAFVPASNVTVFLNTNITSRILSSAQAWSEAILLIDEPHSTSNPGVPLLACGDAGTTVAPNNVGVCLITGTGTGARTYDPTNPLPGQIGCGAGDVPCGRPNVFQARQVGVNSVTWSGVPFDAPGTSGTRVIRITNVRANANQAPGALGTGLIPAIITMFISVTGSNQLPINNPQQTVAYVQRGLVSTIYSPATFQQCNTHNGGATSASATGLFADFIVSLKEGFQSSFKRKNWGINVTAPGVVTPQGITYSPDLNQNVPGAVYNTESAFENIGPASDPTPNPPTQLVLGGAGVNPTAAFPAYNGLNGAGIANSGTRLELQFNTVVTGTSLFVPTVVNLVSQLTGLATGVAVLTSTDGNGAGGFSAVPTGGGSITSCSSNPSFTCPAPTNVSGLAQVNVSGGTGLVVYEVLYSDAFNPEELDVPVAVAWSYNPTSNLPAPGVTTTVAAQFAPQSVVNTASASDPIPRFAPSGAPANIFSIFKCSCNLLFPFVTNQIGYDTGVAVVNTSVDPFGTAPQTGIVLINYYCGQPGCTSPPQDTTNAAVPAGQMVVWTLSGGGQYGVKAEPGFQGYIIAQAQFQFCHGYAFISAQGALPTSAGGVGSGYIALEMDNALPSRTGNTSEVLGH